MASGTENKICNEVLCVLSNNFGKLPKDSILTIINLYKDDEIANAKEILLVELKKMEEGKGARRKHPDTDNVYNVYEQLISGNHKLPSFSIPNQSHIPAKVTDSKKTVVIKKEDQESLTNNSISVKQEDSSVKIEEYLSIVLTELNQKRVRVKEVVVSSLSYPWSPPVRYLPDREILEINRSGWMMELLKKKVDANKEDLSIGDLAVFMYKESQLALHYNLEDPQILTPRNHPTSSNFRIGMFNANGATSKAGQLQFVIEYYHLDILVIVETKMMSDEGCDILAPNGYKVVSRARPANSKSPKKSVNPNSPEKSAMSRGGGIAIICGGNVTIKQRVMENETYNWFEALAVEIEFNSEEFVIVGIYRPGSQIKSTDFLTEFGNFLNQLSGELLICGDFNYSGNTSVSIGAGLVNLLMEYRLFQKVSRPTRNNNLLDLFICSQDISPNIHVCTFDPCISDHHLVVAEVNTLNRTKSLPDFPYDNDSKTAVIGIVDDILHGMKNQEVTLLVSLNFSPIEDTSDCKTVLHNRDQVDGLSDSVYKWMCSELGSTVYQNELKLIHSSMGQAYGNSLFSIFYLLHTASSTSLKITCHQYFEDNVLIYSTFKTKQFEQSLKTLESITKILAEWYRKNKYCISESNCNAIVFGTQQQLNMCRSYPSCFKSVVTIPFSTELKVLGVVLDKTLSFESHMSSLLGLCNNTKQLEDPGAKKEAIDRAKREVGYSIFFLHGVWDTKAKKKQLKECVQELLSLSWNDLLDGLKEFVFNIVTSENPYNLFKRLKRNENSTRSAANQEFTLPSQSQYYEHSFSYAAPKIWNEMMRDKLKKSTK